MKYINRIVLLAFLVLNQILSAQISTLPVPGEQPESGGVGPGAPPASPIDMYVYALMIAAMIFIVFYRRFTTAQRIN